jgi:hypothetical protein
VRTRVALQMAWMLQGLPAPAPARGLAFAPVKPRDQIPPDFTAHDYAVYLLHIAAEIEHVLMIQYLYAAYSLDGPQVPCEERETVRCWQETILGIAKEEMAHLITVQNVLRLIGGPLNLDRNDYPWDAPFYPFEFTLEPASLSSLARYIFAESPENDWGTDVTTKEKAEIIDQASEGQRKRLHQVGKLYRLMIDVLADPCLVQDEFFRADTLQYQASWDEWGRGYRQGRRGARLRPGSDTPDLLIGTAYSRETAVAALKAVAEQGEAPDIAPQTHAKSHFRRFLEIYRAFRDRSGEWSPTFPLVRNPRVTGGDDSIEGTTLLTDPQTKCWGQLLNLRYRMLLMYLSHAFNLSGAEGPLWGAKARGMAVHRTFGEMYNLRTISKLMAHMPAHESQSEGRAGPPFEMPYSIKLPRSERDCWRLHLELLKVAKAMIQKIEYHADERQKDYLGTLRGIDRETMAAIEPLTGDPPERTAMPRVERTLV